VGTAFDCGSTDATEDVAYGCGEANEKADLLLRHPGITDTPRTDNRTKRKLFDDMVVLP
jgi:hypothetical protein